MTALKTVGLLSVQQRKLLLAYSRNKQCFYLPGGKIDAGESATKALCREIAEELNVRMTEQELVYYTHITAPAFGEKDGVIMEQDCYWLHRDIIPEPAAEIGEVRFFSVADYSMQEAQAPGVIAILHKLQQEGFVD